MSVATDILDAVMQLNSKLIAEQEKERQGLIDIAGPSGMRNSQASALVLARNGVRMEVIDALEVIITRYQA